jgi:hypothetical protein
MVQRMAFSQTLTFEILRSASRGVVPHRPSPTSAKSRRGRDLGVPLAPGIDGQYRSNRGRRPVLSG